ncbi:hypothetical protein WAI453_011426 [Rhynchosporium graminicola]|uniref:F-box domain-containing protein n=1 Tax=Rhynchosporium graminicola TaxID=2792576 RepID=A0A1E1L1J5_9HELO|nr:uncharacterized protein RCO7_10051 [Rhynchosporium commune]
MADTQSDIILRSTLPFAQSQSQPQLSQPALSSPLPQHDERESPSSFNSNPQSREVPTPKQDYQNTQAVPPLHTLYEAEEILLPYDQPSLYGTPVLPQPLHLPAYQGLNSTDSLSNLPYSLLLLIMNKLPAESRAILGITTKRLYERLGPIFPSQSLCLVTFPVGTPFRDLFRESKRRIREFIRLIARDIHDGRQACGRHLVIHGISTIADDADTTHDIVSRAHEIQAPAVHESATQGSNPQPSTDQDLSLIDEDLIQLHFDDPQSSSTSHPLNDARPPSKPTNSSQALIRINTQQWTPLTNSNAEIRKRISLQFERLRGDSAFEGESAL